MWLVDASGKVGLLCGVTTPKQQAWQTFTEPELGGHPGQARAPFFLIRANTFEWRLTSLSSRSRKQETLSAPSLIESVLICCRRSVASLNTLTWLAQAYLFFDISRPMCRTASPAGELRLVAKLNLHGRRRWERYGSPSDKSKSSALAYYQACSSRTHTHNLTASRFYEPGLITDRLR